MDKIIGLLKQLGASEQLSKSVVGELDAWRVAEEKALNTSYEQKLGKAKQACLEAVESYKADLAKRVEIFLEARVNTINREAQKQAAVGESEAVRTLKGVKSLIEGVKIDLPEGNQVAVEETKKLRVMVGQLQEKIVATEQSNRRANLIARKLLERNKVLEAKGNGTVTEDKTVTESTEAKKPERLEDLRVKSDDPKTTRPAAVETVAKAGAKPTASKHAGDQDVMAIAEGLDGTPALVITE
jgi:hypothetical protein